MQLGRLAGFPPGDAREDWTILRALSEAFGKPLPYNNLGELRQRLVQTNPVFGAVDQIQPAAWGDFGAVGALDPAPFTSPIDNFYMTDPISRASETMAACTEAFVSGRGEATGTHG